MLARKPLVGTVAANVLKHGTGALNIDGCKVETDEAASRRAASPAGRWPANVVHDGSEEVVGAFPETGATQGSGHMVSGRKTVDVYGDGWRGDYTWRAGHAGPAGSAARFFYSAKADADGRCGSRHPTVKPVDLMGWLCRLVTPPGGVILDPFAGTGTTGEAAWRGGFRAVLIEREPAYQADIARRMALALAGPCERSRAIVTARGEMADAGPLFGEGAAHA